MAQASPQQLRDTGQRGEPRRAGPRSLRFERDERIDLDGDLLKAARQAREGVPDAALIDEALSALVRTHRAAEIDQSYAAYDARPLEQQDEWGDLASFRQAAAAT